jgi:hypothetical protein
MAFKQQLPTQSLFDKDWDDLSQAEQKKHAMELREFFVQHNRKTEVPRAQPGQFAGKGKWKPKVVLDKEIIPNPSPEQYDPTRCSARIRCGNTVNMCQCSELQLGPNADTCHAMCKKHGKEMSQDGWTRYGDVRVVGPGSFGHTWAKNKDPTPGNLAWRTARELATGVVFADNRTDYEKEWWQVRGGEERGEAPPPLIVESDAEDSEDEADEDSEEEMEVIGPGGGIFEGVPLYVKNYLMSIYDEMKEGGFKLNDDWKAVVNEMVNEGQSEEEIMEEIELVNRMSLIITHPDDVSDEE